MDKQDLDERQLADLRRRLDERESELEGAIEALRRALANPSTSEVRDSVEDGDTRNAASVDLVQLQRQEDGLRELRHARDRMHQGSYGRCEECDQPIPFQRLVARPEARYCLQHEEEWEKRHPRQVAPASP